MSKMMMLVAAAIVCLATASMADDAAMPAPAGNQPQAGAPAAPAKKMKKSHAKKHMAKKAKKAKKGGDAPATPAPAPAPAPANP